MEGHLTDFGRWVGGLGIATVAFFTTSCADFEESGLPGSASSMARNQMMFVRQEPPTFGHYRLSSLAGVYPELGFFVRKMGLPDFLAETSNQGRDYFILYYLKQRQAYACRNRSSQRRSIEVAGPYPITDREFQVLDGFRTNERN